MSQAAPQAAPPQAPAKPARARHAWERLGEHRYRCTRCGCLKTNVLRPSRDPRDPPQWLVTFERAGQYRQGLTPPCPGRLPGIPAPAPPPAPLALALPPAPAPLPLAPRPVPPTNPAPPPRPQPILAFLPLLAGPPDTAAQIYRAWLALPRTTRGGCGYCRHSQLIDSQGERTVCCAHPAVRASGAPVPIASARAGGGFPPGGGYDPGGECGLGAALFEARPHG